MTPPDTLSKSKLIAYLRAAHADTTEMPVDGKYFYATGRNILADALIVAAEFGEFDGDEKDG